MSWFTSHQSTHSADARPRRRVHRHASAAIRVSTHAWPGTCSSPIAQPSRQFKPAANRRQHARSGHRVVANSIVISTTLRRAKQSCASARTDGCSWAAAAARGRVRYRFDEPPRRPLARGATVRRLSKHLPHPGGRCCFASRSGTAVDAASASRRIDLWTAAGMQHSAARGMTAGSRPYRKPAPPRSRLMRCLYEQQFRVNLIPVEVVIASQPDAEPPGLPRRLPTGTTDPLPDQIRCAPGRETCTLREPGAAAP